MMYLKIFFAILAVHYLIQALTPFVASNQANTLTRFIWKIWGNDEDPLPPDSYKADAQQWYRILRWYMRNRLHNFSFHVIGVHGRQFKPYGRYTKHVWNPYGGWNWFVLHYRWMRLPFISYRGKYTEHYIGWRESGAFGFVPVRRARSK